MGRFCCVALIAFTLLLPQGRATAAGEMKAGIATVDITPPIPYRMSGYFYERLSTGTKDPLKAKAIVFEQGGESAALVFCDLVGVPREITTRARQQTSEATGIPADHIAIAATHTHTGPLYFGSLHKHLHDRAVARSGNDPYEAIDYPAQLVKNIVAAIAAAKAGLKPVELAAGYAQEDRLAFNRRFFMKDGTVGWNPGKLNPDIVRPAGPIDPDVFVAYFESTKGIPLATYVNFALHLDTVGGMEVSADYPATTASILGRVKGGDMLTLFTNGACGNINHIDVTTKRPQKGHAEAARIGTVLAGEVIKTYASLQPVNDLTLRVGSRTLQLQPAGLKEGDIEKANAILAEIDSGKKVKFLDTVFAFKVLDTADRKGKPLDAEVQVIALGNDIAWVALPGEIFTELGMEIKKASPFKTTIVAELGHGPVTYFPNEAAAPQGNYEVVTSRVAVGSGERLVEAAKELLKELHARIGAKR